MLARALRCRLSVLIFSGWNVEHESALPNKRCSGRGLDAGCLPWRSVRAAELDSYLAWFGSIGLEKLFRPTLARRSTRQ